MEGTTVQKLFDAYMKTIEELFNYRLRQEYKGKYIEPIKIKSSTIQQVNRISDIVNSKEEKIGYIELKPDGICYCLEHQFADILGEIIQGPFDRWASYERLR